MMVMFGKILDLNSFGIFLAPKKQYLLWRKEESTLLDGFDQHFPHSVHFAQTGAVKNVSNIEIFFFAST